MRLALIISLASDRRSGRLHGNRLIPADQAIAEVKKLISGGMPLDPRYPIVIAIAVDAKLREHRFTVTPKELADFEPQDEIDINELLADNEVLQAQVAELKAAGLADSDLALKTINDLTDEAVKLREQIEGKSDLCAELNVTHSRIVSEMATLEAENKRLQAQLDELAKAAAPVTAADPNSATTQATPEVKADAPPVKLGKSPK